MKKRLMLALLLVSFPVYGQEKRSQSSTNKNHPKSVQQPQTETMPSPASVEVNVINEPEPQPQSNGATRQLPSYFSRLVSPENLPTIGLVILGLFGLVYAWKTLRAVETQGDALINSERAWISIKTDMENFNPTASPSRFYWRVVNTGKSVAKLISTDARCLIWNGYDTLPDTPQFGNTQIDLKGRILAPGEPYQFHGYFEDWENGVYSMHNMNNRLDSTPDTLFLLVYGRIRYQTLGKDCESNFVEDYTWVKSQPIPFIGFRPKLEAPAAYAKHT